MGDFYFSHTAKDYQEPNVQYGDQELKICSEIAKTVKSMVGKGPINIKAVITDDCVQVSLSGFLFPLEKKLGQTNEGFFDIKFNRIKLVHAFKEQLTGIVSAATQRDISVFLYDLDPASDYAVMVFKF